MLEGSVSSNALRIPNGSAAAEANDILEHAAADPHDTPQRCLHARWASACDVAAARTYAYDRFPTPIHSLALLVFLPSRSSREESVRSSSDPFLNILHPLHQLLGKLVRIRRTERHPFEVLSDPNLDIA